MCEKTRLGDVGDAAQNATVAPLFSSNFGSSQGEREKEREEGRRGEGVEGRGGGGKDRDGDRVIDPEGDGDR